MWILTRTLFRVAERERGRETSYQFCRLKSANLLWRHKNQNRQIFISKCIAEEMLYYRSMQGWKSSSRGRGECNAQDVNKNNKKESLENTLT